MIAMEDDLRSRISKAAEQAIQSYARGILSLDGLTEQMLQEWKMRCKADDQPTHGVLLRIAQRICSRALCAAWRSSQVEMRNCAFDNLRCYLEQSLRSSGYATTLQQNEHAAEDVLHQTLEAGRMTSGRF